MHALSNFLSGNHPCLFKRFFFNFLTFIMRGALLKLIDILILLYFGF